MWGIVQKKRGNIKIIAEDFTIYLLVGGEAVFLRIDSGICAEWKR